MVDKDSNENIHETNRPNSYSEKEQNRNSDFAEDLENRKQKNAPAPKTGTQDLTSKVAGAGLQAAGVPAPLAKVGGNIASKLADKALPPAIKNLASKGLKGANLMGASGGKGAGKPGMTGGNSTDGVEDSDINPEEMEKNQKKEEGSEAKKDVKNIIDKTLGKAPMPQAKALAFGAKKLIDATDDEKAGDMLKATTDKIEKAGKMNKTMKIVQIIAPCAPYILAFVGAFLVIVLVMAQIMVIRDKILGAMGYISTGVEKILNFSAGRGWGTNEEVFFGTLSDEYNRFKTRNCIGEDGSIKNCELDIPLIAATIHYTKTLDIEVFECYEEDESKCENANDEKYGKDTDVDENNKSKETDADIEDSFMNSSDNVVPTEKTKQFYAVANDKLGKAFSFFPGNKRLLGHLVHPVISETKVDFWSAPGAWASFIKEITMVMGGAFRSDILESVTTPWGLAKYFDSLVAYGLLDGMDKPTWDAINTFYEIKEFKEPNGTGGLLVSMLKEAINLMDIVNYIKDKQCYEEVVDEEGNITKKYYACIPVPVLAWETGGIDDTGLFNEKGTYDEFLYYKRYLYNIYIPATYCWGGKEDLWTCTPGQIMNMVDEIFDQKELYEYLVGDMVQSNISSICSGKCSYDLTNVNINGDVRAGYGNVENVYVRLMECDGSKPIEIKNEPAELVPLEKYIMGVVHGEIEGNAGKEEKVEAWKAQAVAARSYALTRGRAMGNAAGTGLFEEDGKTVIQLRNCANDEAYCDPDIGCSQKTEINQMNTTYPGSDTYQYQYKPKVENYLFRSALKSVEGVVLTDGDGNIINSGFINVNQKKWIENAKLGMSYEEILIEDYTGSTFPTVLIKQMECTSTSNVACAGSGDYVNWKQWDPLWGNVSLGSSNIRNIGCAATSVAILIAKSEVATPGIPDFNPGTFVTEGIKKGLFDAGGGIIFSAVSNVVPDFYYSDIYYLSGDYATKKKKIASLVNDDKCYLVVQVKQDIQNCQHWVAVDYPGNNEIYIMDPAGGNTLPNSGSSCGTGDWSTATRAVCYKVRDKE